MVEPLLLSRTHPQYSRPDIILRAANTNNDEKYAEKEKSTQQQSHRFVDHDDSYSLNIVV
jgi:hypothetical protein